MILWFKLVLVYGQRHNLIVFVRNFISVQWRSHSSIAGIVNYHVFKFMVPLSAHLVLKELRRVGGCGGGFGDSNYICSREGDNNFDNNIVIKTTERDSSNMCSLRSI